jgi:hypothetical protein
VTAVPLTSPMVAVAVAVALRVCGAVKTVTVTIVREEESVQTEVKATGCRCFVSSRAGSCRS